MNKTSATVAKIKVFTPFQKLPLIYNLYSDRLISYENDDIKVKEDVNHYYQQVSDRYQYLKWVFIVYIITTSLAINDLITNLETLFPDKVKSEYLVDSLS